MRHESMKRKLLCGTFSYTVLFCLLYMCAEGGELQQKNPIKAAPSQINTSKDDGYPVFSKDGNLFLFTRNEGTSASPNWNIFVTYLKNRSAVIGKADGALLPALTVAPVQPITALNTGDKSEKAIAYCESSDQGPDDYYYFTLFFARDRSPSDTRKMLMKATVTINLDINHDIIMPIIVGTPKSLDGINNMFNSPTEPMLTRDGNFLFWAGGFDNNDPVQAQYIRTNIACNQLAQSYTPYENLSQYGGRFPWIDQYGSATTRDERYTKSTNYHTVIELPNGTTGLIFERCHGQVHEGNCSDPATEASCRDLYCDLHYDMLQDTGFSAGQCPSPIDSSLFSGVDRINGGKRVTHPWISGPQSGSGAWLLFFTRLDAATSPGQTIYYTRIKRKSPSSCPN